MQNRIKSQDVAAARADLNQAQATLQDAIANRRQVNVKQQDVLAAQAALRQAQAALVSTQANGRQVNVKAAGVQSAQAQVRQAEAALGAARANARQIDVKNAVVSQAQAQLARAEVTAQNARSNLEQTRVVAPSDGVVLTKYVDKGSIIQSGQSGASGGTSIVQLANVSQIYVDAQVDEADIAQVKAGQRVNITLDAYPQETLSGSVRKVYPKAETTSNVTYVHVQVMVDAKDVSAKLRPAMNATCEFITQNRPDVLNVPSDAVKETGGKTTVTVIKDAQSPLWDKANQEVRSVKTGVAGDDATEIVSGLTQGETIVTKITAANSNTSTSTQSGTRSIMGGGPPPR